LTSLISLSFPYPTIAQRIVVQEFQTLCMYLDRELAEKISKFCKLINSFTICSKKALDRLSTAVCPAENGRRGERGARNHAALERAFL